MTKAEQIFEKHIGLNAELGYLPIKKQDVIDAINEALTIADVMAMFPSSETIEANGIKGGLRDGELQMFWEGAEWLKSYLQKRLLSKGN